MPYFPTFLGFLDGRRRLGIPNLVIDNFSFISMIYSNFLNVANCSFPNLFPTFSTCGDGWGGVYIDTPPTTSAWRVVGMCAWLQNNPCLIIRCMYNYINDSTNTKRK